LRGIYGSTAEFLGRVSDARLSELYAGCRALIVPNVEEFGIAAVEAQASGRPVIAASVGGACETVIDGETGVLITPGNVGALAEAMAQVDFDRFSPERLRIHAQQFAPPFFAHRFADAVQELTGVRAPGAPAGLTFDRPPASGTLARGQPD
jgi:glycosyltransferase involved in cell wall biosynthesis